MFKGFAVPACSVFVLGAVASGALAQTTTPDQQVATTAVDTVAAVVEPEEPRFLTPMGALVKDTIDAGGDTLAPLGAFYAARDYEPFWTGEVLYELFEVLAKAGDHGLPAGRYSIDTLSTAFAGAGSEADRVAAELAASQAFLTYARDLTSGLLEPKSIDSELHVFPKRPDQSKLLMDLSMATDKPAFFADLAPKHPHYTGLLSEKARLEQLISTGGWGEPVAAGKSLRPGQSSSRVAAIRARLGAMDGELYGESETYDEAFVEVIKAFQRSNSLNDDGVVGPVTLAAINADVDEQLKQVLVNLERQRWLNFDRGARHIYVNQADFSVTVFQDEEAIYTSRVVVGKSRDHRTPEFSDEMSHMVVNPTWHVPRSIATEEYLPRLKRNPGALSGQNIQVMTRGGTKINPVLVDFSQFNKSNFPFIMKQPPSRGNALGRVKFMFPNQFNIYLHDTPAKNLFNRDVRAFSHGCVRVQKPFELAHTLLAPQSANPKGTFQAYLDGGRERRVNLETPVPVHLTYQTAWVDNFGEPQYRADIYGRDAKVMRALEAAGVTLAQVEG